MLSGLEAVQFFQRSGLPQNPTLFKARNAERASQPGSCGRGSQCSAGTSGSECGTGGWHEQRHGTSTDRWVLFQLLLLAAAA